MVCRALSIQYGNNLLIIPAMLESMIIAWKQTAKMIILDRRSSLIIYTQKPVSLVLSLKKKVLK